LTEPTTAIPTPPGATQDRHIGGACRLTLNGGIDAGTDLSGIALVGDHLFLGADEGHQLQVLSRGQRADDWDLRRRIALANQGDEADIEAIAYGDGYLYVAGSHSARRRLMKADLSVKRNRERLLEVRQEASRSRLYRLAFDPDTGEIGKAKSISLTKRLRKDPLLKLFWGIPSKENGIDIEGIDCREGTLYAGFRGPVLRDNYVPLMRFPFDDPKAYRLLFVRLDGQGIRDLAALEEGFLLIAGPVNDAPGPFRLWWWDGEDQIPGKGRSVRPALMLGEISTPGGAKAEGLTLVAQHEGNAEIIVLYETDSVTQAVRMQVPLPG
jgi:hypothetical protein